MSSYFDAKTRAVSDASDANRKDDAAFLTAVAAIEAEMIQEVILAAGDREFPADLREKAMALIARWHVGIYASLPPTSEALDYALAVRSSELVERMHSLFHEIASRRVNTRFGLLSDHPRDIVDRRDEHDAAA
jgi:hypothetical protein